MQSGPETNDEEIVCRICRLEAEPDNPLFHPCKCSGTIKFVHQDCLNQWLKHSGHTHCEVCKHQFSFTPLYAADAPSRLSWFELLWGLGIKGSKGLHAGSRVLLVLFVWLSVVPLSTCWLWRLGFTRSLVEAFDTIKSRAHPVLIFADCVQGSLISSVLIFLVLFVGYVWEQVRFHWNTRQVEARWEREQQQQQPQPEQQAPAPMSLVERVRRQQQQQQHERQQRQPAILPALPQAAAVGNPAPGPQPVIALEDASQTSQLGHSIPAAVDRADRDLLEHIDQEQRQSSASLARSESHSDQPGTMSDAQHGRRVRPRPTLPDSPVYLASQHVLPSFNYAHAPIQQPHWQEQQQQPQQQHGSDHQSAASGVSNLTDQSAEWGQQLEELLEQRSHRLEQLQPSGHQQPSQRSNIAHPAYRDLDPQLYRLDPSYLPTNLNLPPDLAEAGAATSEPSSNLPDATAVASQQQAQPPAVVQQRAVVPAAPPQPPAVVRPDDEPMAFEELVGLQGPVRLLFENAGTVVFSTAMFMAAALWVPFTWGRITIKSIALVQATWQFPVLPGAAMQLLIRNFQGLQDLPSLALPVQNGTWPDDLPYNTSAAPSLQHSLTAAPGDGGRTPAFTLQRLAHELEMHLAGPDLSDWLCLGVGYVSLAWLALTAVWLIVSWKMVLQRWRPNLGRHSLMQLAQHLLRDVGTRLVTSAGQAVLMGKVMLVLMIELAILPVLYGFWLDVCALPLLKGSLAGRLALLRHAPVSWSLLHWLLGMASLMATAGFLSVIRSVLRPGALPWLKDPFDPEVDPLQQVLSSSLLHQLEREATTLATMSCLAVLLLHLPIKLASLVAPSLFPLAFRNIDSVTEVPADMLLLHVCLPFTIPHLKIRVWSRVAFKFWLRSVGSALDLEHYLLPAPTPAQPPPQPPPQTQEPIPTDTQAIQSDDAVAAPESSIADSDSHAIQAGDVVAAPESSIAESDLEAEQESLSEAGSLSHEAEADSGEFGGANTSGTDSRLAFATAADVPSSSRVDAPQTSAQSRSSGIASSHDSGHAVQSPRGTVHNRLHSHRASSYLPMPLPKPLPVQHPRHQSQNGSVNVQPQAGSHLQEDASRQAPGHQILPSTSAVDSHHPFSRLSQANRTAPASHMPGSREEISAMLEEASHVPSQQSSSRAGSSQLMRQPQHAMQSAADRAQAVAASTQHAQAPGSSTAEQDATAAGLAANSQIESTEELTGRLLLLAVLMMLTLLLLITGLLTVPCLIGRTILHAVHLPLRHDLYCTIVGGYAIWGIAAAAVHVHSMLKRSAPGTTIIAEVQGWLVTLVRLTALSFLGLIMVPFMAGLYLDLVMMPLRVRPSESPVMFVYQDWACGLLLLKVFYRIARSEGNLPSALVIWRERFQNVQRIGVTKVPFAMAFTQVLWPMMKPLAYLLAIPYAITRGIVPLLNLTTEEMQSLYVFGFTIEYVLIACYYGMKHAHIAVRRLHNSIRDDRYLVGRQLNNFLNAHM